MRANKFGWRQSQWGPTSAPAAGHPITHNMTHYFDANMPNAVLAAGSSLPVWILSYIDPSESAMEVFVWKVLLPFVLFTVGKVIDIKIKLYLEKRRKANGTEESGEDRRG